MGEAYPPWNFKWVIKGELAVMGYPKNEANVNFLVEKGICHLVSLSPEKQPAFEYFPNHFRWTPIDVLEFEAPTLGQINAFMNIAKTGQFNKEAVGVHCRLGKGRSGVMAACYLVRFFDQLPEVAVTNIRLLQPGAIETLGQERSVREYYEYIRDEEPEKIDEGVHMLLCSCQEPPLTRTQISIIRAISLRLRGTRKTLQSLNWTNHDEDLGLEDGAPLPLLPREEE
ncbi:PTPc_DSPc [Nesidiocoris tenuis]|uniref:PTPc_DSPc n=1 Tax=Nesidiocoris tenuis TaxID=355587 RepID=A0ABN7AUJ4_9HEMI|nr:PTPc_DSPc [Nesidiocoris tenuis]